MKINNSIGLLNRISQQLMSSKNFNCFYSDQANCWLLLIFSAFPFQLPFQNEIDNFYYPIHVDINSSKKQAFLPKNKTSNTRINKTRNFSNCGSFKTIKLLITQTSLNVASFYPTSFYCVTCQDPTFAFIHCSSKLNSK